MSAILAEKAPPVERTSKAVSEAFMSGVFEVQHPLIACHITRLRDQTTPPAEFRQLVNRLASLLAYDSGALGPADRGQRILLHGPVSVVRAIRDMARVATVATGVLVATELRRQWADYADHLLNGGAVRQ